MVIEGYHACRTDGGIARALAEGPFRSDTDTYLGVGFYLWEGFKEHGVWWGECHIWGKHRRRYFVLRCDIEFEDSRESQVYFDLLGRTEDKKLMIELLNDAVELGYENEEMNLGEFINWLRELNKEKPGIFPYRIIRALDATKASDSAHSVHFKSGSTQMLDLGPRVMICFHDKGDVHLHQVRVVHTKTD